MAESLVESMEEGMEETNTEGSDSEEEEDTDTLSAEWETVRTSFVYRVVCTTSIKLQ